MGLSPLCFSFSMIRVVVLLGVQPGASNCERGAGRKVVVESSGVLLGQGGRAGVGPDG